MKKTTVVERVEEVETEAWFCDKCGVDITMMHGEHARKQEQLRIMIHYGSSYAHTSPVDLIDADFDFCGSCVRKATEQGKDSRPKPQTYKEETARYLERVAALLRSTDK